MWPWHICTTMCTRASQWEAAVLAQRAQPGALRPSRGAGRGRAWRGLRRDRTCVCLWLMHVVCGRSQPKAVKNYPLIKKKTKKPCIDLGVETQTPQKSQRNKPWPPLSPAFPSRIENEWNAKKGLVGHLPEKATAATPVLLPGGSQGRGAWWAAVYGVAGSQTWLSHASAPAWGIPGTGGLVGCRLRGCGESDTTERLHFHALEKEMATHSSVVAWRIPGTGEPGGLPSIAHSQTRLKRLTSSRIPWSLYSCTPCTILCSTHICMTLRDITFGHLSILPYPLKWKLHTGRASDVFTLWHILQVLKKRAVEWLCGAHL